MISYLSNKMKFIRGNSSDSSSSEPSSPIYLTSDSEPTITLIEDLTLDKSPFTPEKTLAKSVDSKHRSAESSTTTSKSRSIDKEFDDLVDSFVFVEESKCEPLTEMEWKQLLDDPKYEVERNRIFASLQEGVPRKLRKRIWLYLANVEQTKEYYATKKNITYKSLLESECSAIKMIKKDVSRTYPEYEIMKSHNGVEKDIEGPLTNILKAYANLDPEIGYTQGMNFLAATLLHHMDLEKIEKEYNVVESNYESEVFWVLVHIMMEKGWRRVYMDGTPKLLELLRDLEARLERDLTRLHGLLTREMCLNACFSQCYLTLLCYNSPLSFAKRVLDMFLLDGEDVLTDILMKMLAKAEPEIFKKRDMELIYPFLRNDLVKYCYEQSNKTFSNFVTTPEVGEKNRIIEYPKFRQNPKK